MTRPKFDTIYSGEWPYTPEQGVGIRMTGYPLDRGAFVHVLMQYSCPVDLAHRIADAIYAAGTRETTVMHHLDFDKLALDLDAVNVSLEIVPPRKAGIPIVV